MFKRFGLIRYGTSKFGLIFRKQSNAWTVKIGRSRCYIKNQSYQNMLKIKVNLPFLYSRMKKKIVRIQLIFDIENLTINTKSNQIIRTFLLPFSWIFGLVYFPLNSATLSCSSVVTLGNFYYTKKSVFVQPAREVIEQATE